MKVQGCPGTGSIQYITVWVVYITFVCTGEQYTKVHTHTYGIRYRTQIINIFEKLKNRKLEKQFMMCLGFSSGTLLLSDRRSAVIFSCIAAISSF